MEEKEKNKKLICLISILIVLALGLVGYIIYDKVYVKPFLKEVCKEEASQNITNNSSLSLNEIQDISIFINRSDNYALSKINYSEPKNILNGNNKEILEENVHFLRYSLRDTAYSHVPSNDDYSVIWGNSEIYVATSVTTSELINQYFKDKINYEFSEDIIKKSFNEDYFEKIDKFAFRMSDTIYEGVLHIVNGHKSDYKYYLTLDNGSEIVLDYHNYNYYFYSCKTNN